MDTTIGSGTNAVTVQSIRDALLDARSRAPGSLPGLGDDDFAEELAELTAKYGGPVANAVYDELQAARDRDEQALMVAFIQPTRRQITLVTMMIRYLLHTCCCHRYDAIVDDTTDENNDAFRHCWMSRTCRGLTVYNWWYEGPS